MSDQEYLDLLRQDAIRKERARGTRLVAIAGGVPIVLSLAVGELWPHMSSALAPMSVVASAIASIATLVAVGVHWDAP